MRASLAHLALAALICGLAAALPGSNPCSRGPGHWCSSLAAARSCGALSHCGQLWSRSSGPQLDPADITGACITCRLLADDLTRLAADGPARLREAGAAACSLVADADSARICRQLLSAGLPELLTGGLQPAKACVMAGQCRRLPNPASPSRRTDDRGGSKCSRVLRLVQSFVNNARGLSQDQITTELRETVCPGLRGASKQQICYRLTGRRDLTDIIRQLARGSPAQVCADFKLGSATPFIRHPVLQLMRLKQEAKSKRLADSIECQVCEELVTEARQMLRDGKTQAEIESFVESIVCNSLPQSEKDQCVKNVQDYGPIIFQLLASELDPKTVCEALGACGKTKTIKQKAKLQAGPQCLLCEFVMREIEQQLGQNATQAEIESALLQVCSILPQTIRQECDNFVQQYTPIIIQLLVNGLSPQTICTTLGLCTSSRRTPAAAVRKPVRATPQCLLCEFVMREVEQQLGQNATQSQIEAALEQVCNLLPQTIRQECDNFVQQYTPTIIQLLVSGLSPERVCTTLGLCSQMLRLLSSKTSSYKLPTACDTCQTVVVYVKSLLKENATEQEIIYTVEKVCNFLPTAEQATCKMFVDQYGPSVIQLLLQDLSPAQVCQVIGLCTKKTVTRPIEATPQCLLCEFVMREVEQQLGQNATQAQIEAALEQVCNLLPQTIRQECDNFVQQYTPTIIQLLVSGLSPERVCTTLGLCSSGKFSAPIRKRKPVRATPQCLLCEFVMREVEQQLGQNATQAQIEAALEQVCNLLPQTIRQECDNFVQQYTPTIIQLLVSGLSPERVCTTLGLCSSGKFSAPIRKRKPVRATPQCLLCEFVMREVEQQLGQNATQAQIEAALEQVCNLLPQTIRQECDNFVQQYTPTIIQLLVSGLSPERVCTTLGLCTQLPRSRVSVAPLKPGSHAGRISSTACDVCQTVIQYAKALLQENATEQEIVQLLERVCPFLPTAEQAACKSFIGQYGAYVIQLLLQDADPKQICQLLGLCSASSSGSRPLRPLQDRTLRYVRPARGFPATANGLVQMVRGPRRRPVPIF